jgi:hypothetical protein
MKRKTGLGRVLAMALAFMSLALPLFAQKKQVRPDPALPSQILGPQLIAWSQLQSPQPLQQTRNTQEKEPAAQTFTGTIVRDGNTYALKVSTDTTYPLVEQEKAKPYEGEQVRVSGIVAANGESLHILSIEPVS